MHSPRSWYSPEAVRNTSLVSSRESTNSRVSSSISRRLQRRLSPRDLRKRIGVLSGPYIRRLAVFTHSPESGKLLLERQHWSEKIAVAVDALEHRVLLEG